MPQEDKNNLNSQDSDYRYLQAWADSAQGEFTAQLQFMGFVLAGMFVFLATADHVWYEIDKKIVFLIFFSIFLNSSLLIYAIRNHRVTLWNHFERKAESIKNKRDNLLRHIIFVLTVGIFIFILIFFLYNFFCLFFCMR